ncbi:MAG: hypothetical protein GY864_10680 [Desulfobacterales bacterium]|nr:hypothetical protein [Desulfobacterales bacterium]
MRLRSTGLGATELFGELTSLERKQSGVLMLVKIKKPVVWRVRAFLQPADLRAIVWRALMPWNVWFVIKTLLGQLTKKNNPDDPESSKGDTVKK